MHGLHHAHRGRDDLEAARVQAHAHHGAAPGLALDGEAASVSLDDLGHLGEAAAAPRGGRALQRAVGEEARVLLGHADARVAHLDDHPARLFARRADPEVAAVRHGLHGVEDETDEGIAQLEGDALDGRQRLHVLGDRDGHAPTLGVVPPARSREIQRLLDDGGEPDGTEGDLGLARDEILEPAHGRRGLEGDVTHDEKPAVRLRVLLGVAQEKLGIGEDGGERVVEVVREPTHRLAEGAQVMALVEPSPSLRHAPREIAGPAPERQDGAVELDLGARHLSRDVLDLFVVREQERILGGCGLGSSADPAPQLLSDPSH